MINFIETLFGIGIVGMVAALVLAWRGNRRLARQLAYLAAVDLALGGVLEIYVRIR